MRGDVHIGRRQPAVTVILDLPIAQRRTTAINPLAAMVGRDARTPTVRFVVESRVARGVRQAGERSTIVLAECDLIRGRIVDL
jgi:hypothetical protein